MGAVLSVILANIWSAISPSEESRRLASMEEKLEPFIELARGTFPDVEIEAALDLLQEEISSIHKQTEIERRTFKTLSAELVATFSGKWKALPYPNQILSSVNHQYYVEILAPEDDTLTPIRLYATEPYTFETIDAGRAIFKSKQSVPAGALPLGKTFSVLQQYNSLQVNIPFIIPNRFEHNQITIEHLKIVFSINGEKRSPFEFSANNEIRLQSPDGSDRLAWASVKVLLDKPVSNLIETNED